MLKNAVDMFANVLLAAKCKLNEWAHDEKGEVNIIAIIIIIAIAIALAIIFRNNLKTLFDQIWTSIFGSVGQATQQY